MFVQKIPKNANYEEFLTKFVNTNNYTHYFVHGVLILQGAKNYSQQKYMEFEKKQDRRYSDPKARKGENIIGQKIPKKFVTKIRHKNSSQKFVPKIRPKNSS